MTRQWKKMATVGAKAGTDLKDSGGTVLADTAVKNASIALGISGTGLTLTNAGSGVTLSNSSVGLGSVANVDMRDLGNATAGTLASARGGTGITNFANSTHANTNTTKANVGLSNVDNDSTSTIRSGTTKANVGLGSVDNDSTATIRAGTTAGNVGLGNVTNESKATMFTNSALTGTPTGISKTHVGLSNVANETRATILGGELTGTLQTAAFPMKAMVTGANAAAVKTTIALNNVNNTSDATVLASDHTGDVTGKVNNVAVATVTSGAALGTSSNQDSTATIRNGVTTYVVNKGTSIVWSNLAGNMTPNDTYWEWTITWRNGSGTSLGTTVIRTLLNGTTALAIMSTTSNGASATVNLGGAVSSGNLQTTTVTLNSIVVSLTAKIIDGSGWDFK